jgi:Zn-finger in ubiquitin-hydrolases and other protein
MSPRRWTSAVDPSTSVSRMRDQVHLRVCQARDHVGSCDSSPDRHAPKHFLTAGHPVLRSFEPGEDWFWCYADQVMFDLPAAPRAVSRP